MVDETTLTNTRESLHAVAELVLAGAQYTASQRITLQSHPGGFGTRFSPDLRVEGIDLVGGFGRIPIDGSTARALCEGAGIELADLSAVYTDGATFGPDDQLSIDTDAAAVLTTAWTLGHQALLVVAPGSVPILWPEHFDIGLSVGDVNLGVSPGDAFLSVPYAYVGPWAVPENDDFFDAPFGAARPVAAFGGVEELAAYFNDGLQRVALATEKDPEKL